MKNPTMCFKMNLLVGNLSRILLNRLFINGFLGFSLLGHVECKHCTYTYDSGHVKHFFCSAYEYCCGPLCCRSRSIGFFQLWYFWLMIILMLMLCSGGGWWYKFRYRGNYRQGIPTFGGPATGGFPQPMGRQAPPPYPVAGDYLSNLTGPQYPTNVAGSQYNPYMATAYSTVGGPYAAVPNMGGPYPMMGPAYPVQPVGPAPPAYAGPPPSYAAATAGMPK